MRTSLSRITSAARHRASEVTGAAAERERVDRLEATLFELLQRVDELERAGARRERELALAIEYFDRNLDDDPS